MKYLFEQIARFFVGECQSCKAGKTKLQQGTAQCAECGTHV